MSTFLLVYLIYACILYHSNVPVYALTIYHSLSLSLQTKTHLLHKSFTSQYIPSSSWLPSRISDLDRTHFRLSLRQSNARKTNHGCQLELVAWGNIRHNLRSTILKTVIFLWNIKYWWNLHAEADVTARNVHYSTKLKIWKSITHRSAERKLVCLWLTDDFDDKISQCDTMPVVTDRQTEGHHDTTYSAHIPSMARVKIPPVEQLASSVSWVN